MRFGLKLGSVNKSYTRDILSLYEEGLYGYIELFAIPGSFADTIQYWRQFTIPIIIHAPHSAAGLNLSDAASREKNRALIEDAFRFADELDARYVIFHSGVNGTPEEAVRQLRPYADRRCLIENKPLRGLNGERCVGTTIEELHFLLDGLDASFCLDFGHAVCSANSQKLKPLDFIRDLMNLQPVLFHLTDGDYASELDSHLHYGEGSFPLSEIFTLIPEDAMVTNEAKHDSPESLEDFRKDCLYGK